MESYFKSGSPSSSLSSLSESMPDFTGSMTSSSKGLSDSLSDWKDKGTGFMAKLGSVLQGNTILQRVAFVVLVFICFIVVMSVGTHLLSAVLSPTSPYIVDGLLTATNGKVIPQDPSTSGSIPIGRSSDEDSGIEFSWSVWVNISNLDDQFDQYKHIFSKGDNHNVDQSQNDGKMSPNNSPGLYIKPSSNTLVVFMNTFESIDEEVEVANIPLNKWVHVLIRVEGTYLDVYINGILAKRHILPSVPKQNNGNIYIAQNGGFNGFISNLRYYDYGLQPGDIMSVVQSGPSLKLSSLESSDLKSSPNYLSLDWYFQNAS
jgi:hypothetical protein